MESGCMARRSMGCGLGEVEAKGSMKQPALSSRMVQHAPDFTGPLLVENCTTYIYRSR